jgi:glyoxylase-like metal-dependent hydrolase (beta-lactamase superfamily II)
MVSKLNQISKHVVVSDTSNNYYEQVNQIGILCRNFIVGIDANLFPTQAREFRNEVEKKFGLPVKYLILTHSHTDHIGGMQEFKDTTVISSEILQKNLKSKIEPSFLKKKEKYISLFPQREEEIKSMQLKTPDIGFSDLLILQDDDVSIECHYGGGHTKDSLFVYVPSDKILIAGDLLWQNRIPNSTGDWSDPEQWIKQLKRIKTFDVDYFIPGHGAPILKSDFDKYLNYFIEFRETIQQSIKANEILDTIQIKEIYNLDNDKYKKCQRNNLKRWYNYYKHL